MYVEFYVPQKYEADKMKASGTDLAHGRLGRDNAHRVLVGKSEGTGPLGRRRCG